MPSKRKQYSAEYRRQIEKADIDEGRRAAGTTTVTVRRCAGRNGEVKQLHLEDVLSEEATAHVRSALGEEALVVPEAREARRLGRVVEVFDVLAMLGRFMDEARCWEVATVLVKELGYYCPMLEATVMWVRNAMIEAGAKEEDLEKVQRLEDLREGVNMWFVKELRESRRKSRAEGLEEGREEGRREAEAAAWRNHRAILVRLAGRKFSVEAANELAALLEGVSDLERIAEVADLIVDCTSGAELLARAAETA